MGYQDLTNRNRYRYQDLRDAISSSPSSFAAFYIRFKSDGRHGTRTVTATAYHGRVLRFLVLGPRQTGYFLLPHVTCQSSSGRHVRANEITPRYQEFYQELTNRVAPHYQELREPITARHGLPRFDQSQSVSLPRFESRYFVQTVIFCCILHFFTYR
ncbi:hypothetical protein JOB18_012470 [Solea senegalensis]|uniref:Uncharacterized protein n=1 Tax=Solea senegalensis TaxID=28829 RepID=A0AAV6RZ74_SOLSE|nr:hypothetical protein JOB18_012470 [Solea senegalensis]